ncbi:MAG: hypothetical protein OES57_15085 [Acidimicrobiia bacterium]|nr:hypothetical protein [Acidimicrobiia bacterium]
MTTTIDERRHHHRYCTGGAVRGWYRPHSTAGRLLHRGLHLLTGLVALAAMITVLALGVAAMVAAWQWILG